jgi:predicted metal-binding membrane protein
LTVLEAIVRHERRVLVAALVAVPLLCFAWIVPMARDMYGAMTGSSAWMMTPVWDARHTGLLAAMWIVMMIGMMLPSASPTLLMYAAVVRRAEGSRAALRVYAVAAGYAVVWSAFAVGAALLQRTLSTTVLSPMMTIVNPWAAAAVLALAAVYQLTPIKGTCLESCRSPVDFITAHMQPGLMGAFRLGADHGVFCVGCCWALMLLLFAGGVMNLWTIAALTAFVLFEKVAPFAGRTRQVSAAGLLAAAAWSITRFLIP